MSIFDLLEAGAATIDLVQTKKKHPEAWSLYNDLYNVFMQNKIDANKVRGSLTVTGEYHVRDSIFRKTPFKCQATINPTVGLITMDYRPEPFVSADYTSSAIEFTTRVNANLLVGRFLIHGKTFFVSGKGKGLHFIYRVDLVYGKAGAKPGKGLLINLLTNCLEVAETFSTSVAQIDQGLPAIEAAKSVQASRSRPSPNNDDYTHLVNTLVQYFDHENLNYHEIPGERAFAIMAGMPNVHRRVARVTDQNQVVFESYLETPVPEAERDFVAKFIAFVNVQMTHTGKVVMDYDNGAVSYRNGIDVREDKDQLTLGLIQSMLRGHINMADRLLFGVKHIADGSPPKQAIEKMMRGDFQDTDE